jgi:hypothetical protein
LWVSYRSNGAVGTADLNKLVCIFEKGHEILEATSKPLRAFIILQDDVNVFHYFTEDPDRAHFVETA